MTARDFCYWLQGMFELTGPPMLDVKQTDLVKRHLALVFQHDIDPSAGGPAVQEVLQKIHDEAAKQENNPLPHFQMPDGPGGIKYRC